MSARLKAIATVKSDSRILDAWDEGEDGLWATLRPGWKWEDVHALHESTPRCFLRSLKMVKPCNCEECNAEKQRAKA